MGSSSDKQVYFDIAHQVLAFPTAPKSIQLITRHVAEWLDEIGALSGTITVFCKHTSASLTIQENADPTVQDDVIRYLDDIAPESRAYAHSYEGPDDMPAHLKTMLTSASLTIPVQNGAMVLGTWQGIYLMEHRAQRHTRNIHLCFTGFCQ